jgi:hypothetical protein
MLVEFMSTYLGAISVEPFASIQVQELNSIRPRSETEVEELVSAVE